MSIIPPTAPKADYAYLQDVVKNITTFQPKRSYIVEIRGYRKSMGVPGKNDTGMYDDYIGLVHDCKLIAGYNANVDPQSSKHKQGRPFIVAGLYPDSHTLGFHKDDYLALRQTGNLTVIRELTGKRQTGRFALNIHEGGLRSTFSEGCQTIPPGTYTNFIGHCLDVAISVRGKKLFNKHPFTVVLADL
jgi:lysozyme